MSIPTQEALSGLRLLVCMAKADGVLKSEERFVLEDALAGLSLPDGLTLEKLLDETNDAKQLALDLTSAEGRDYTYASVYALAYCDRDLDKAEEALLEDLRASWGINKEEDRPLATALEAAQKVEIVPEEVTTVAVTDEQKREEAFSELLTRYSILAALTGAIPIPFVPDLMVVPLQVKMVHSIAGLFGMQSDKKTTQTMFKTLGVGTGARLGITALCKLVPVWGSVVGSTSSFATTFALGKVAYAYFKAEGKTPVEDLKPLFREEAAHGKEEFKKHEAGIAEAQRAHADTLKNLAFDLQQGKITRKEYEAKIDALQ